MYIISLTQIMSYLYRKNCIERRENASSRTRRESKRLQFPGALWVSGRFPGGSSFPSAATEVPKWKIVRIENNRSQPHTWVFYSGSIATTDSYYVSRRIIPMLHRVLCIILIYLPFERKISEKNKSKVSNPYSVTTKSSSSEADNKIVLPMKFISLWSNLLRKS